MSDVAHYLNHLNPELSSKILEVSSLQDIPKDTEILREGQYVKVVPIVLEGLIKVFTRQEDRELLLYYIQPRESCIMSFSAGLDNEPSSVFAQTEEDTRAILLPVSEIVKWVRTDPHINTLFFQQFKQRYSALLDTIHHIMFNKLDKRLYDHLLTKTSLKKENPIKISHQQLADELGTVREVISRVMKKLESDGLVKQRSHTIEVFNR